VSARREIHALWIRCDGLHAALERSGDGLDSGSRRQLDACIDELASALRRLGNASMLSRAQAHSLESAVSALAAVRANRLPALDTVTAYEATLRETAAALHIRLPEAVAGGAGHAAGAGGAAEAGQGAGDAPPAEEAVLGSASDAVEALAFVTSAATAAGHHLGGFSRDRTDEGFRLTARCWTCGREVSIGRGGDEWWFVPVTSCVVTPAESDAVGAPETTVVGTADTGAVSTPVP
jgi:hypothetical protein